MQRPVESIVKDNFYWIYLNRPGKLNALNSETWTLLESNLKEACNSEYLGIALTGRGRAFSSGDDIYDMYYFKSPSEAKQFFHRIYRIIELLVDCKKPLAALINGLAAGGGGEIILFLDYNVALKHIEIFYPEVNIGLYPPMLITHGRRLLGSELAMELATTARRLTTEEALKIGIIDDVASSINEAVKKILEWFRAVNKDPRLNEKKRRKDVWKYLDEIRYTIDSLAEKALTDEARAEMGRVITEWRKKKKGGV
ncbi:MAG: enoyl-CoA hydratase/isomerase family protein [Desulfurococcales archaeon]|nr:enoyl-CoA hydratase/isomerase family protein [Desulfurococcales archaeon]